MTDSILNTIKKMLGIPPDDTAFDVDILVNINAALLVLSQVNVGPTEPLVVVDQNQEWSALTTETRIQAGAKVYIFLNTKKVFDPPGTSFVNDALKSYMDEILWRLEVEANPYFAPVVTPDEV